ncbi:uncharacterized protein KZ484_023676 isoform 2-T2 [Pholidichthys leucotaenia]
MFRNGERTKKKARSEGGVGRLLLKLPRYHPACTAAARKSRSGGTGDEDSEYQPPTSPQPPAPPPAGTKDGGQKNLNSGEMQCILSLSKIVLNNLVKKSTASLLNISISPQGYRFGGGDGAPT